jgi:serpin B
MGRRVGTGRRHAAWAALLFMLAVGGANAGTQADAAKHRRSPPPTTFRPAVATGAFGLDLMRAQPPGNVVLSPDSVAAALAMTGAGAGGRTATEMADAMHLKGPQAFSSVGDLQQAILAGQAAAAAGDPEPPTLEIADGLFVQSGLPVEPSFLAGAAQHFAAAPEAVDFAGNPAGALETINNWVSAHTHGKIPRILEALPPEMALALANAVYLDADWEHPFKKSDTAPGAFHRAAGPATVEFMHETETLPYGAGPGYRAVALPYRSSALSLMIVLPAQGKRLGTLQHRLDGRSLARIARGLSDQAVILDLPRFHLNTEAELKPTLESLGMPTAFGEAANFSGITTAVPLKIGFVKHAADFTVDEKGTVAAAATVVGIEAVSARPPPRDAVTFNANRPFLFFLRDDRTGAVLFAGRVTDPPAPAS